MLIAFGLLPFCATEMLLRICTDCKTPLAIDPCLDSRQVVSLFELDGTQYRIRKERLPFFAPAQFDKKKHRHTKRIFCLGGSTTQGEPYKPPTAFPAWLERNLALIDDSHHWEVINCGGLSYASYRLLPILYEVLEYEPDLIVLECGHNEFLEDREFAHWQQVETPWKRTIDMAHSLRLVQLMSSWIVSNDRNRCDRDSVYLQRDVDALLDYQGGLSDYHRESLHRDLVESSFRWNVETMVDVCQNARIPIIVMVPTANVRDCPPFKADFTSSLDTNRRTELETLWLSAENWDGQVPNLQSRDPRFHLDRILDADPMHAGALFWRGRLELENGNIDRATEYLVRARDADVCPLRASSTMQQTVKSISSRKDVWCLDVDELFRSVSKDGIVGNHWLVDHVHPRIEGHQLLGENLAEMLLRENWVKANSELWREHRSTVYRAHLQPLGEDYYLRGKQRLAGLMLWTQGRAKKGLIFAESRP